ncbi:GDSL esterase/lipase At3g48460-like [Hibiscus syriacus]|uniref:GDSL esterase/lipase At3g48460-like n=1 Tax=Hibiscus syriacus TaxID=106335 RepID=UPI0019227C34|nr:GDSL esterase/lipase At3g48460-like [Hibiscus syriacus]
MHSNLEFNGRSSNGCLVIDFLCDSLNISVLPPFEVASKNPDIKENYGVNFAVGGSTSLSSDFFSAHKVSNNFVWQGTPLGFQTQIEWFNQFFTEKACNGKITEQCKAQMGNNLIWIGQMGADDFARVIGSSVSLRWLTDITLDQIFKILTTVLDSGAKFIVVQGLPPVGCWPLAKLLAPHFAKDEMGCSEVINKAAMAHNDLLQKTLDEFQKIHSESIIAYADYYNAFKTIMGNLSRFGFSDGVDTCCGVGGGLNFNLDILCGMPGTNTCSNPDSYIHWDGLHLTEAMHKQISLLFLHDGFCKPPFSELVNKECTLLQSSHP